jgi:hypothetical protein
MTRGAHRPVSCAALVLVAALGMRSARAEERTQGVALASVAGDCPSREAVVRALQEANPSLQVQPERSPDAHPLEVLGDAAGLTVRMDGQSKRFDVAATDCEARARVAAVPVALVLVETGDEGTSQAPEVVNRNPELPWVPSVELGPLAVLARGPLGGWGLGARVAAVRAGLGLSVSASVTFRTRLELGSTAARAVQIPLELAFRLQSPEGPWTVGLDLGARACVLRLEGEGVALPQTSLRVIGQAALSPFVRWKLGPRYGLSTGLSVAYSPMPLQLGVEPLGTLGSWPQWWFSGTAAFFWELR